jgi:isocitrate/isopropylmalate dehydrogenase
MKKITVLPGDGIGPEVTSAAISVLKAMAVDAEIISADCGYECYRRSGESLPVSTMEAVDESDAVLMGCITVPSDDRSFRNPVREIKRRMRLELNIRRVETVIPELGSVSTDMTFLRSDADDANMTEINGIDSIEIMRSYPYLETERMLNLAGKYIDDRKPERVICACHGAETEADESFVSACREHMSNLSIPYSESSLAALAAKMTTEPLDDSFVLSYNPYSDILSDFTAELTGGRYLIPCASVNGSRGLFRPLHGSNPQLVGYNSTNPTATLRCTAMMLDFLGFKKEGEKLWDAVRTAYKRGFRTPDVGGGTGTYGFIEQITKICDEN